MNKPDDKMDKIDKPIDFKSITWLDPNNCFPIVLNVLFFVLFVMCFVSLYRDNLEIIGFGMFFALHVMMGISMLKTLFQTGSKNPEAYKLLFKQFNKFIFIKLDYKFKALLDILKNYVGIGQVSIATTILLVFVAFIMIFITFRKLKVRHKLHGIDPKPAFIPEPSEYKGAVKKAGYEYRGKDQHGQNTWNYGYYLVDGVDYFMNDKYTIKMKDEFKKNAIAITVLLWVIYNTVSNSEISEYVWPRLYFMIFAIVTLPFSILFSIIYNLSKLGTELTLFKNFEKFKQYNQLYNSVFIKKDNIFKSLSNLFNRATPDNPNTSPTIIQLQTFVLCVVMLVLSSINISLAEKIAVRNNAIPDPNKKIHRNGPDDKRLSEDREPTIGPIYLLEYKDGSKNTCPNGTIKTINNKNGILECIPDQRMSKNNFNNWPQPPMILS